MKLKSLSQRAARLTQKGYSMVELMLALVVIGILAVPVYYVYRESSGSAKAESEATNLNALAAVIRSKWKTSGDFTGLSESALITQKSVPEKMVNGTALKNVWDGAVTIGPSDVTGGTGTSMFKIVHNQVPVSRCLDLVSGAHSSFSTVIIASTTVKSPTASYSQGNALTACSPSTGEVVVVQFIGN